MTPHRYSLTSKQLSDAGRESRVSAARWDLIGVAVLERGIRLVDVRRLSLDDAPEGAPVA